jgi:hypothetical protein
MFRLNFRPLRKKIESFPIPVNDYEVIEKERILEVKPVIYLEGDLEKVKKTAFSGQLDDEMKRFSATTYTSGPFIHYQIQDMLVLKNRVYFEKYEYLLNPLEKAVRLYDDNSLVEVDSAAFSSMRISTVFFGHWLREELPLIDYLQGKGSILSTSSLTPQKSEIVKLFNLDYQYAPFSKIKVADMFHGWQHSEIYLEISNKYKQKISLFRPVTDSRQLKIVYLGRGQSATKRVLSNEKHLLEYLDKGFRLECFVAESTPIKQLYTAIYDADIILSVEGSQMAHAIMAGRAGSTLLCIQPPYRFYNPFKDYCADIGLGYSILVAEEGETEDEFSVDVERLKRLIDTIDSVN